MKHWVKYIGIALLMVAFAFILTACQANGEMKPFPIEHEIVTELADEVASLEIDEPQTEEIEEEQEADIQEDEADDSEETVETASSLLEGADYEEHTVLVTPSPDATAEDVAAALGIDSIHVTESSAGLLSVSLPQDITVEQALETLKDTDAIASAQPNFIYYLQDDEKEAVEEGEGVEEEQPVKEPAEETSEPIEEEAEEAVEEEPAIEEEESLPDEQPADDDETLETQSDIPRVNDTYLNNQWSLESIDAFGAWDIMDKRNPEPVTVAIIDEGFDVEHKDLSGNIVLDSVNRFVTYNAYDGSSDVSETSGLNGHGTHVAGIVAAVADNWIGVAGVSYNQKILPIKVFHTVTDKASENYGKNVATTLSLLMAYDFILDNKDSFNIRVINISLGQPNPLDEEFASLITKAYDKGVVTVGSAGNEGLAKGNYPSDYDNVVGVMNLRQNGDDVARSSSSNYNEGDSTGKGISAPGTNIYSTYPNNKYRNNSGTSMAAPCVAGVLAMMFAVNPKLTAAEAINTLYTTARDLGPEGFDAETGWGEVNAAAAVQKSLDPDEAPLPTEISKAKLSPIKAQYYTGKKLQPAVKLTYRGQTLLPGTDYTVSYKSNKKVGTASVTIKGIGLFTGTTTATFKIIKKPTYKVGASQMPVNSTSAWEVQNGTLKVVSGKGVVSIAKDGVTVKAKKKGTAKVAVVDAVGRVVKSRTVKVYKFSGTFTLKSASSASTKKLRAVKFVKSGSLYQVKFTKSKKYLTAKATKVVKLKKSTAKAQKWKITVDKKNRLTFTNRKTGKVLAVKGTTLVQRTYTGALKQKWVLS